MRVQYKGLILPCPFCGGLACVMTHEEEDMTVFWVECEQCGTATRCGYLRDVIEIWNNRCSCPKSSNDIAQELIQRIKDEVIQQIKNEKGSVAMKYGVDREPDQKASWSIHYKKASVNAREPTYATPYAVGADLYACTEEECIAVPPGETVMIGTGISAVPPDGFWLAVFARSGLSAKCGLRPANCVGVIDPDYTGEIYVAIHNDSDKLRNIHNGDRIAQLVAMPLVRPMYVESELPQTARGENGFGSTGK